MPNPKDLNSNILDQRKPWADNDHLIWLVTTVHLSRNIDKYLFPSKLETHGQKQIISLLDKELLKLKNLHNPKLLRAEKVTPLEKEFLTEHYLTPNSFHQAQTGQSFVIDDTGRFLGTVNIDDHLNLLYLDTAGEIENTWNNLIDMEMTLGGAFSYSFSSKFGFLTSDPMHCGTGLKVAVYMQVSGLLHTNKLEDILAKLEDENVALSGLHGSATEIIGDILVIENNYTLGLTEENIISNLRAFCTKLQVEEKTARKAIKDNNSPEIKDKVSRAYGVLVHSYQIEAVEALNALSLLKLGVSFDWVKGISVREVNELFFNCRRAHLLRQFKQDLSQEELLHKRAEYIHQHLKGVSLAVED
jgi:protein arginine kinase